MDYEVFTEAEFFSEFRRIDVKICQNFEIKIKLKSCLQVKLFTALESPSAVLWITFLAINRPSFSRFEWDFTFFATICTNCFVHLAWSTETSTATEAAAFSKCHVFTLFVFNIYKFYKKLYTVDCFRK